MEHHHEVQNIAENSVILPISRVYKVLPRVLGRFGSQFKWAMLGREAPVTDCGLGWKLENEFLQQIVRYRETS